MTDIYQIEPSYDDLAFEPKMTWEELVKFAKDYGYVVISKSSILYSSTGGLVFCKNGEIRDNHLYNILAENRTYEQMKAIIENMYDKEK